MPSSEYHLKQAQVAARLVLAESDPVKAAALLLLALHHEKAAQALSDEQEAELPGPSLSSAASPRL
jgi:hypothetical protein